MICVDQLRKCGAPWHGGEACHMISDESIYELYGFARQLGLSWSWFQPRSIPHFDIAPRFRERAIQLGAVALERRPFVEAMRRFRAANRQYLVDLATQASIRRRT